VNKDTDKQSYSHATENLIKRRKCKMCGRKVAQNDPKNTMHLYEKKKEITKRNFMVVVNPVCEL
jgi:hypothetical protein